MKAHVNRIRVEKGAALVMVIIAFLVITILATSVLVMTQSNTAQVSSQEDAMETYYIARSGAEATYQALIETSPSMLTQFSAGNTIVTDTIIFDEGSADVSIQGFNEGSTRRIRIISVGTSNGTVSTKRSVLEFDYVGYGKLKWSR